MEIAFKFMGEDAKRDATLHFHALDLYSALWDLDQLCRNRMKHEDNVSEEEYIFLEKLRAIAWDALQKVDDL